MKDFKNQLRKDTQNPLFCLSPDIFKELPYQSLSNEDFFNIFSDLVRKEFSLPTHEAFLQVLSFETLIQEKFIEFLKDYKLSFENLPRPLSQEKYQEFIRQKEVPLKRFFKCLKEYIWKLLKYGNSISYELHWVTKNYDDCSICDVLAISEDFCLMYDILFVLWKFDGNGFFLVDPPKAKEKHFHKLWDFLFLYADSSGLKWADLSKKEGFKFEKKPRFLIIGDENNGLLWEKPENPEVLDLEQEFTDFNKTFEENKSQERGPNEFIHFLIEKGKVSLCFKNKPEIKLAMNMFYYEDPKQRQMGKEFLCLASYLCWEIIRSPRGTNLKRVLAGRNPVYKLLNSQLVFHELGLLGFTFESPLVFDYLQIIYNMSYNDVFPERDYRKTPLFGTIEEKLMNYAIGMDFNKMGDDILDFYRVDVSMYFLKNHLNQFVEFASKAAFLSDQGVDIANLERISKIFIEYTDNQVERAIKNPGILLENKRFYWLLFQQLAFNVKTIKEKRKKDVAILASEIVLTLVALAEGDKVKDYHEMLSMENIFSSLIDFLSEDKLEFLESILKNGYVSKLERLILKNHSQFATILYSKYLNLYYNMDSKLRAFGLAVTSHEDLFQVIESIVIEQRNLRSDPTQFLHQFLGIDNFKTPELQERVKKFFLTRFFVMKSHRNGYANYEEGAVKRFAPEETFDHMESIAKENNKNIITHLDITRKAYLDAIKEEDQRKIKVISEFCTQINQLLFHETINLFMTMKKDYGLDFYPLEFVKSMIKACALLYSPLNGTILKPNPLASIINTFSSQFISVSPTGLPIDYVNLLIVEVITLAYDKIDESFPEGSIINKVDLKLLYQFYAKGFQNMDPELKTEKNFRKCEEFRHLEFLLSVLKKYVKRQRSSDWNRMKKLIEELFIPFINYLRPYFKVVLDSYLMHFIEEKYSPSVPFAEYMKVAAENPLEFAEIICLKQNRMIKNMFLFLKSFGYYRDNSNVRPLGAKILHTMIKEDASYLELSEKLVNLEELFEQNKNCNILFVNIFKHKIFMRMWNSFKMTGDNHPEPLILNDISSIDTMSSFQTTINFYLSLYNRLNKENKGELNKYSQDISSILRAFYFKSLFVNFALNDLLLMKTSTSKFEVGFLKALTKVLAGYFKTHFEIFDIMGTVNIGSFGAEFEEFGTNFLKISFCGYFENVLKYHKGSEDPETKELSNDRQLKIYTCLIFLIYAQEALKDQLSRVLNYGYFHSEDLIKNLLTFLNYLGVPVSNFLKNIIAEAGHLLGLNLKKKPTFRVCFICGLCQSQSLCDKCGFNGLCCDVCGVCRENERGEAEKAWNLQVQCKDIIEKACKAQGNKAENDELMGRMVFASVLVMNIFQDCTDFNPGQHMLFEEIYSNMKDPRNSELLLFFEQVHRKIAFQDQIKKQKYSLRVLNVLTQDLLRRTKQLEYWENDDVILLKTAMNVFKYIEHISESPLQVQFETMTIKNLLGTLGFCCAKSPRICEAILIENILLSLMNINFLATSSQRPNEADYTESILRFLEILTFDREYVTSNTCRAILEEFFKEGEFIKKLPRNKFCDALKNNYEANKPAFSEAFNNICETKISKTKEPLVKLKKEIINDPDIFLSRRKFVDAKTIKFLKQLGENIVNSFFKELELFLMPFTRSNSLMSFDIILKLLTMLKTEYPLLFELMANIPIELQSSSINFAQRLGIFPIEGKATFFEYYLTVIVGFGFGMYNTFLIDTNITKKMNLGFVRKNGKVFRKEDIYISDAIRVILDNFKRINLKSQNLKENFTFGLVIWNYSNFILNCLNRLSSVPGLEEIYEGYLLEGFEVLGGLVKAATKEEAIVLQALEIESKMSLIYKEHLRVLFFKKAKSLGLKKEMGGSHTKYYFQKRLEELFEGNEETKIKAFTSVREKPCYEMNSIKRVDLLQELENSAQPNPVKSAFEFINRRNYTSLTTFLESNTTVFGQILHHHHKKTSPSLGFPTLNTLFDTLGWKTNANERKELLAHWNRLSGEYDRFKNGPNLKFCSPSYKLPDILKNLAFVIKDKEYDEKSWGKFKGLEGFVESFQKEYGKVSVPKVSLQDKSNENSAVVLEKQTTTDPMFDSLIVPQVLSIELNSQGVNQKPEEKNHEPEEKKQESENKKESLIVKEESKTIAELKEEKKDEKPPEFSAKFFEEREFDFLDRFYFFLDIEKHDFLTLSREAKIKLLDEKYSLYIDRLRMKYEKTVENTEHQLKEEREQLGFLMCEKYLSSEEDQYMFSELQELKFFIVALKKAGITTLNLPNDEMFSQAGFLLNEPTFALDSEVGIDKVINFNINQYPDKKRYQVFDREYLGEKDNAEDKPKTMKDFYVPTKEFDSIYDFEFFSKTLEVDDELLLKLFEMLTYSVPDLVVLNQSIINGIGITSGRGKSTFLLIKILCFNYRNFIRITQLIDHYLDQENYKGLPETKPYIQGNASSLDGKQYPSVEKCFSALHILFSAVSVSLIKGRYSSNYFIKINTDPSKSGVISAIQQEFGLKEFSKHKTSILQKIFQFYIGEPDLEHYTYEFDVIKNIINALFSQNIFPEQIPLEKAALLKDKEKSTLELYPFFQLIDNPTIPNSKGLSNILFQHHDFIKKKKINVNECFFRLLTQNSVDFIPALCSKLLPQILHDINGTLEALNKVFLRNKEKLKEDGKTKVIDYTNISSAVNTIANNFDANFPAFNGIVKCFTFFVQNLIKLARKSIGNVAKEIRKCYQKGAKTEKDFQEAIKAFEEIEMEIVECLRNYTFLNKQFVYGFRLVVNVMVTIEDILKLYPQITKSQKTSSFEIYVKLVPAFKSFFRVISFLEMKNLELAHSHDIGFLIDDLSLPEMKRIQTKEGSVHKGDFDVLGLEKSSSSVLRKDDLTLEETFGELYRVQDSMRNILMRVNEGRSPSVYKVFFKKTELNRINVFLKMEYIKWIYFLVARKENKYDRDEYSEDQLNVDRKNVFNSAYEQLKDLPLRHLTQYQFKIQFNGESGIDGGGLTREFITLFCTEIFNPDKGLFCLSSNKLAIQPNPFSFIVPNHLNMFKFIGNMIGRIMIEEGDPVGVTFTKSFLKLLLNKNLNINDFENLDPSICKNLLWMLENDVTELEQSFSYIVKFFDKTYNIDLIENGSNIPVVESNKKDYVKAFCLAKMNKEIRTQTHTFMKGIVEIIPHDLISLLSESELGMVLSGISKIDVNDMKETAILSSYTKDAPVIVWLWEILEEYTDEQRASFHFFLSGAFRPPFGGFKNNPITISKLTNLNKLPIAHTCSRNMELPNYSNKEILREKLAYAIFEGCSSYEFG